MASTDGNSKEDWLIFEILCGGSTTPAQSAPLLSNKNLCDGNCGNNAALTLSEHHHDIDLVTTLRSELAALSCKNERLTNEVGDVRANLIAKNTECDNLRAQVARQSTLISSLQNRLQAAEGRELSVQSRCDATIETIQREKRSVDEKMKDLMVKIRHLEDRVSNEEGLKEQLQSQLNDFMKRLSVCLAMEACESAHLTTECVITRAEELMTELQRTKAKVNSTCDTLNSCENELLNFKSLSNIEKQHLSAQLERVTNHENELEARCRQYERDLQLQRERVNESEINLQELREELRGFESRCHRLQANLNRAQNDRLQFLRYIANLLSFSEPCETLIKDKLRELLNENKNMHEQVHTLRDQISCEHLKLKETQETTQCRLKTEEAQKCELEERLEKCHAEIYALRKDQMCLTDYLHRLARALHWNECDASSETNILAEKLLEKAEHLTAAMGNYHHHESGKHQHHQHNHRIADKNCCDHHHHYHNHGKLRRDMTFKENTSSICSLQKKVRVLKEQLQRKDLHLELVKRKLAIIEEEIREKCLCQGERDEAICRAKKANKIIDKLTAQLVDSRSQIAEVKAQLTEAVEYKITALERARKIDDLSSQICDLELDKTRLLSEVNNLKERLKLCHESDQIRRCRDEKLINSLRDDLTHLKGQLSDANYRLSHLQNFRTSVARTLHLRDLSETELIRRLQTLCSKEDHQCSRSDDATPLTNHCQALRHSTTPDPIATSVNNHDYNHSHNHNLRHGHFYH